jgi:hypothetical protein
MTESLGNNLPKECVSALSLERTVRENSIILLLTVDEEGFPRVCLLSPYQVICASSHEIFFEVYQRSQTEKNLNRQGESTFVFPESIGLLYVRGRANKLVPGQARPKPNDEKLKMPPQSLFHFTIEEVLRDVSSKAPIISQLKFDTSTIGSDYQLSFEEMRKKVDLLSGRKKLRFSN